MSVFQPETKHWHLELKRQREKEFCHDHEVMVYEAQGECFSSSPNNIDMSSRTYTLWGLSRVGAW